MASLPEVLLEWVADARETSETPPGEAPPAPPSLVLLPP